MLIFAFSLLSAAMVDKELDIHSLLLLYFMNIIANIAEPASFLKYITPFGYTESADIIADGSLSAVKLLIGLGIALAGILLAFRKYSEKDLN